MPRRTFFSFHYEPDVWRAFNVRNSWVSRDTGCPDRGFLDASVFEATRGLGEAHLKVFLRDALDRTSVTCILAGARTSKRRWVRYEIARSFLRGNGLLTVDVHGLRDRFGLTSRRGADPLSRLALFRRGGRVYLAERSGESWVPYRNYRAVVPEWDLWFEAPGEGRVVPLSRHYPRYNFCTDDGRRNLSSWIENAAELVGR